MGIDIILFIGGIAVLWISSELVVRNISPIARVFGLNELVVTILGVSVFSSLPEFSVSAFSALKGNADIAVGSVIGSNFVTLTFVTAVCAMIAPMNMRSEIRDRESSWMILSTITVLLLATDGVLSRADGIILVGLYIPYVISVVDATRRDQSAVPGKPRPAFTWWVAGNILIELAAIGGVIFGASLALNHGQSLGKAAGIPDLALGAVLFAFGTSLPELAIAVSATMKKKAEISMGEIYSSNIFTALCVLGACCIITPLRIADPRLLQADMPFLILAGVVVQMFVTTGLVLNRIEAGIVLLLYAYFALVHLVPGFVPWRF